MTAFTYIDSTLSELAQRCYIDNEQMQEVDIVHRTTIAANNIIICRYCNDVNASKILAGFCYCQQQKNAKIYRQKIIICSLCFYDYSKLAHNHLLKQQNENNSSNTLFVFPRLVCSDMEYKASKKMVSGYLSHVYGCVYNQQSIDNMTREIIDSMVDRYDATNDNQTSTTENSNNGSSKYLHHQKQQSKPDIFNLIRKEYDRDYDVRAFFYHNDRNISKDFKRLWPLRYHLQKYV